VADFTLYIGNKTYSSWSLRAWLALKAAGVAFDEVVIPLGGPGTVTAEIGRHSPSGRVPAMKHGDLMIWDSLAIGEYVNELFPKAGLLPESAAVRATCRSLCAEMHSSFAALRTAMPMNVRREPTRVAYAGEVEKDVERIQAMWDDCRTRHGAGGPYLYGRFTLADAMYAPVATRFRAYGVPVSGKVAAYVDAIYAHPAMREWIDAAKREPWSVPAYEAVGAK
jgi:glutathione S-transferase